MTQPPARLDPLIASLQETWSRLYGSGLRLVMQPAETAIAEPIRAGGNTLAWLESDPQPGGEEMARLALGAWAAMLGALLGENQVAEGLTAELITAWNRLTFLNNVIALIRTTTNPLERSLKSIQLAAQALEVENAFLAIALPDGIKMFWASPIDWHDDDSETIVNALNEENGALWCNDRATSKRICPGMPGVRSFVGQRFRHGDGPSMYVGAINRVRGSFNTGDIQIFDSLLEMLTNFMESAALHERELEIETLNRDLSIAADIQASFLPSRFPKFPGHEISASVIPASMLGGDLCDIVDCGHGQVAVIVCDVAGKGISAALLAAELRAILRSEVKRQTPPDETLQRVNSALLEDMEHSERFATTLLMLFGPGDQPPRYASAGHTTGLLIHSQTLDVDRLTSSTVPLGILAELDSGYKTIDFNPGDVLLIYSDGLTETQDEEGEILGINRVLNVLLSAHRAPAQVIVDSLIAATDRHRGTRTLQDDLTLVVIRRTDGSQPTPIYVDHFTLTSDRRMLAHVETRLARLKQHLPVNEAIVKWLMEVQLAVTEAVSNIIIHAYHEAPGTIHCLICLYPDRLEIDLVDSGDPFEMPEITPRELDIDNLPEGGFGLSIINDVMDEMAYQRVAGRHNYWQLSRRVNVAIHEDYHYE